MKRAGVFYSVGLHLEKCLHAVREDAEAPAIILFIPPGHSLKEREKALATEVVITELVHYSPKNVAACLRLLKSIKAEKLDEFVVMFDSLQLRLLASISGVNRRRWCDPRGRLSDLRGNAASILLREGFRRASGAIIYAMLWTLVRVLPVKGGNRSGS